MDFFACGRRKPWTDLLLHAPIRACESNSKGIHIFRLISLRRVAVLKSPRSEGGMDLEEEAGRGGAAAGGGASGAVQPSPATRKKAEAVKQAIEEHYRTRLQVISKTNGNSRLSVNNRLKRDD